jgi:hypothetical protein
MPIHDWTRVNEAAFHDFHLSWAAKLSARLNGGILPPSHFAMTETVDLRPPADFCELSEPDRQVTHQNWEESLPDATENPPRTWFRVADDRRQYACVVLTIRDDLHQPVSAMVFITRQDHETAYRQDGIVRLAVGAMTRGIHLLIVDLFPPNPRNPQGIHKLIWDRIRDEPFELPADKPLTAVAYSAGAELVAYVEPMAVGDRLPNMPIFLTSDRHVPCPLDETYQQAWDVFPAPLKPPLESPPAT